MLETVELCFSVALALCLLLKTSCLNLLVSVCMSIKGFFSMFSFSLSNILCLFATAMAAALSFDSWCFASSCRCPCKSVNVPQIVFYVGDFNIPLYQSTRLSKMCFTQNHLCSAKLNHKSKQSNMQRFYGPHAAAFRK